MQTNTSSDIVVSWQDIGAGSVKLKITSQNLFTCREFYNLLGPRFKYNTSITDVDISAINLCTTQISNSNLSEFLVLEKFLSEGPAVYYTIPANPGVEHSY